MTVFPLAAIASPPPAAAVAPWLAPLATVVTEDLAVGCFFREVLVHGREHLPAEGPVLLAPTHRARWDALILPHAVGRRVTGRGCRFMVTTTEMAGLQGWFLQRLGCFAIDQSNPGTASLRLVLDLLGDGQQVVVFPEGRINRDDDPIVVAPGVPRLATLARSRGLTVPLLPVGLAYSSRLPLPGDVAAVEIGAPVTLEGSGKAAAADVGLRLAAALRSAEEAARRRVGRPLPCT